MSQEKIMLEIGAERERQDSIWGEQNHSDYVFAAILGEEFGETQQAMLKRDYENGNPDNVRAELIQVASVAVGWLEAIDRRRDTGDEVVKCFCEGCGKVISGKSDGICKQCENDAINTPEY